MKGLAFAGALLELEQHFSFDTFAGTSAGAIAAVLLGAGYNPQELVTALSNKDFRDFRDASSLRALVNFIIKRGLYPGDAIQAWINELLQKKLPQSSTKSNRPIWRLGQ
ncbi:MAG: patatin-like phospholipase family protein [Flavobacteriales bacterium]|nr:patatin-like phospholipase family protein [Flavobacteriales bacterium]